MKVKKAQFILDYFHLELDKNAFLVINNPISLNNSKGFDPQNLSGLKITKVEENSSSAKLVLNSGDVLEVDLRDESYDCPEAIVMKLGDGSVYIWR